MLQIFPDRWGSSKNRHGRTIAVWCSAHLERYDKILRDKVKSVDITKELGVNSIKEKVREMRQRWYGHMQRMEENNEVRAIVDMIVLGKIPRGTPRGR